MMFALAIPVAMRSTKLFRSAACSEFQSQALTR